MRVNIYREEMTDRVEIVEKNGFTGVRFYLESSHSLHHSPDDDDSSAVTFWSRGSSKIIFEKAIQLLDTHHAAIQRAREGGST